MLFLVIFYCPSFLWYTGKYSIIVQESAPNIKFRPKMIEIEFSIDVQEIFFFSTLCFAQPGIKGNVFVNLLLYHIGSFKISMVDFGIKLSAYMYHISKNSFQKGVVCGSCKICFLYRVPVSHRNGCLFKI